MSRSFWKTPFFLALALVFISSESLAQAVPCPVGVNVNSFQNFGAEEQQRIIEQLKNNGVRFVRTSLRPDDKNITLARNLQEAGIGLVLVLNPQFMPNAPLRPADAKRHLRSAMPLSYADPERSRTSFQVFFDRLDAKGVVLAGIELGNEINCTDFNEDFSIPGYGKAFTLEDLSQDPEAKQVAKGFLQYLKVLKALKKVRDHSKLNKHAPIISAGMAATNGGPWQQKLQEDSVSISGGSTADAGWISRTRSSRVEYPSGDGRLADPWCVTDASGPCEPNFAKERAAKKAWRDARKDAELSPHRRRSRPKSEP